MPTKPLPPVPTLEAGWLWQTLFENSPRWKYWNLLANLQRLPKEPIPELDLQDRHTGPARRMLEKCLDVSWTSWSSWGEFEYVLNWMLFALDPRPGHRRLPAEPHPGANERLYRAFDLKLLLDYPSDYWGDLFAEARVGQRAGFYPTPHALVEMMAQITIDNGTDHRLESFSEPAVGTGRMMLHAAGRMLRLTGQDINPLCILACEVNAWLYAPWAAIPIRWIETGQKTVVSSRTRQLVLSGQEMML